MFPYLNITKANKMKNGLSMRTKIILTMKYILIVPNSFIVHTVRKTRGTEEAMNGECMYEKQSLSSRIIIKQ